MFHAIVNAKNFRLRRAQSKHKLLLLAYRRCIPAFGVFPVFCLLFFGTLESIFCPPFPGPWGANILLPPIFRDPGGQMKKVVAPLMGGKINPPGETLLDKRSELSTLLQQRVRVPVGQ